MLPSVDSMVEDTPLTIVSIDDDESVSSVMFDCSLVSSVLSKISFRANKILINEYLMQHKDILTYYQKKKYLKNRGSGLIFFFSLKKKFFLNGNLTSNIHFEVAISNNSLLLSFSSPTNNSDAEIIP